MKIKALAIFILAMFVIFLHGCGFGGGTPPEPEPEGEALYFPLNLGTSWTYRVTEPDSAGVDSTYEQVKVIDSMLYFELDSATGYNPPFNPAVPWYKQDDQDSSFYQNDGEFIWLGEFVQDIIDFGYDGFVPMRALPLYYEDYDSFTTIINKGSGAFSVEIVFAVNIIDTLEEVTTEMGTFYDCIHINATLTDSSLLGKNIVESNIWFADSIGEVKRHDVPIEGTGKEYYEELIDYSIGE